MNWVFSRHLVWMKERPALLVPIARGNTLMNIRFAKRKNIHLLWMTRDRCMVALFEKQVCMYGGRGLSNPG